jgi:anthranilate synthase/aminodeoxychorismate synthase-like glutamine amidotransferase
LILVVDNYDSFTYNLVDYFNQLEIEVEVLRNDASLDNLLSEKYCGVVLSPGPGLPENAGNLMDVLDFYYAKIPVLGICLGHQAIGAFFDGKIIKAQKPMHGKLSQIVQFGDDIFKHLPSQFTVVRYHSLICSNLSDDLQIIAKTGIGEIMALKHVELPIYGLQFHPEAVLTEYGLDILRNWASINSITH